MVGAALAVAGTVAPAAGADAGTAGAGPRPGSPTVLVLVPELHWADAPPVLDGWAKASLSLRSANPRAGAADGYLTVGKGARSATPSRFGLGPIVATAEGGLRLAGWDALRDHDRTLRSPGELGTLGQALVGSGLPWALVTDDDVDVAAAAADRQGVVARAERGGAPAVRRVLGDGARAVVTSTDAARVPAVVDAAGEACVIVASVSSPERSRHLGVLAASAPCRLGRAGLTSPATHQDHLATLVDVAPTFLERLGVPRPEAMMGSVVEASTPVTTRALVERDERVVTADRVRTPLVLLFVGLSAAGAVVAVRRPRVRPVVAYVLLAVLPASWLIMAVPWWRWGLAGALLAGSAVAGSLALGAAALGRHDVTVAVGVLAALTAAVVGIDALFGGKLEIDAPFGNSPVVAGRFYGVGNIGSGMLAAGLVLAGGLALDRWSERALAATGSALAGGVVAGAAPWFGADVGGVLSAVPAYGTLLLGWRRGRPALRLVALLVLATLAVLALFVAVDVSRPAADRTHLGRAFDEDLAGDIGRKASKALATVKSPLSLVVLIGGVALARAGPRFRHRPALRATAWALLVAGVLGSALNDSGLLVGAAVMAVAWPALLVLGDPVESTPPPSTEPATAGGRIAASG